MRPPQPPPSVLVIEDHATLNEHIAAALRSLVPGVVTAAAHSLTAAQACLRADRFTVIWSDLGLPDAQGLVTLQAVRRLADGTPVVVFSGSVELADAIQAQGVAFFAKPQQFSAACDHIAHLARDRGRA
jgi:DNA-binding NtrC family response regulator